jgi:hypothetical protein
MCKWKDKMKEEKNCVNCGTPCERNILHCNKCASVGSKISTASKKERRRLWAEKKLCMSCGAQRDTDLVTCNKCTINVRAKNKVYVVEKRKSNAIIGLCYSCNKPHLSNNKLCEKCYYYKASGKALKTKTRWKELQQLLIKQDFKCYYTGIPLTLGVNTSIDHVIPTARGGSFTIDNIVWVHIDINVMKRAHSVSQFIELCNLVVNKIK